MVLSQAGLGQARDRFGRKPIIVLRLLLTASFYIGLATTSWFPLMLLVALIAGLGTALTSPALSAFYLDITAEQHRSRVIGVKESSAALGGVMGPLRVVGVAALVTPKGVFIVAAVLMFAAAAVAVAALRAPRNWPQRPTIWIGSAPTSELWPRKLLCAASY